LRILGLFGAETMGYDGLNGCDGPDSPGMNDHANASFLDDVIPAQAGIHFALQSWIRGSKWMPVFAGMAKLLGWSDQR
jgi:hypothetical protein